MMHQISLRLRLTILSAIVLISVAIVLTAVSTYSANRLFIKNISATLPDKITIRQSAYEGLSPPAPGEGATSADMPQSQSVEGGAVSISPKASDDDVTQGIHEIQLSLTQANRQFNMWGIVGLIVVTLMGILATWLVAGRALKPVRELSDAIEQVGDSDFSRRVDDRGRKDEIGQLAHSFNTMMDKVSASFARQKRFAASAAHELKTPLSTIQVGLDVLDLDAEPDPERMKKALTVTRTSTNRMIRLMDDLLKLSAEESYAMDEEMPVGGLFSEILTELSALIQEKELEVSVSASPEVKIPGNRNLFYRALFNLVENAAKYNKQGGTITLLAGWDNGAVAVEVSDTGMGIPPADLEHIFEPFYRADRSRSRAMGGAGLGLSLVQEIIRQHGGSIEVKSTLGEGTTFLLHFPAARAGQEI